jgi:hypothetical protein
MAVSSPVAWRSVATAGSQSASAPYSGSFSGTLKADGAGMLRIDPPVRQGCSHVAGDGTFTGTWSSDGTILIETSEAVTCLNVLIPNPPTQQHGTRTIRFHWWRPSY